MTKKKIRLGVGLPTVIFIILTLTLLLFAALSFLEGRGSLSLTERSVEMSRGYYAAVQESEERLMALTRALAKENAPTQTIVSGLGGEMRDEDICVFSFDAGSGRTLLLTVGGLKARAPGVIGRSLMSAQEESEPMPLYIG